MTRKVRLSTERADMTLNEARDRFNAILRELHLEGMFSEAMGHSGQPTVFLSYADFRDYFSVGLHELAHEDAESLIKVRARDSLRVMRDKINDELKRLGGIYTIPQLTPHKTTPKDLEVREQQILNHAREQDAELRRIWEQH